jgi:hypothetical protein
MVGNVHEAIPMVTVVGGASAPKSEPETEKRKGKYEEVRLKRSVCRRTCHTDTSAGGSLCADGMQGWHVVRK